MGWVFSICLIVGYIQTGNSEFLIPAAIFAIAGTIGWNWKHEDNKKEEN